jgi:acetyltransferase-like isoleucine patch superfamily enzyme
MAEFDDDGAKFKGMLEDQRTSSFRKYRDLVYGDTSLGHVWKSELIHLLANGVPGGLGFLLRSKLYRALFPAIGKQVVFGRNMTLRHTHKIRLGSYVVVDDNCVLDAKGRHNQGIVIGDHVFIGRNTIMYCKNGDMRIGNNVTISSNCQFVSANSLTIGDDTVIGAYAYFVSGGEYDYRNTTQKFPEQDSARTKGPFAIGANCWIGAHVTILDGISVGEHCVIGAGAVVTKSIPANSLAYGMPARVMKQI